MIVVGSGVFSMSLAISRSLMKFFGIVTDRLSLAFRPPPPPPTIGVLLRDEEDDESAVVAVVVVFALGVLDDTLEFLSGVKRKDSGIRDDVDRLGVDRAAQLPVRRSSPRSSSSPPSSGRSTLIFFD